MQNLLLIPAALAILTSSKPTHNISGRFEGLLNDTVIVHSCDVANILRASIDPDFYLRQDTLVVHNGRLDIDWPVERPTYFTIRPLQALQPIEGGVRWFQSLSDINFFLDKGESVAFTASPLGSITMRYTLTGSALNQNWSKLRAQTLPDDIESTHLILQSEKMSDKEQDSIHRNAITPIIMRLVGTTTQYIRQNPGDPLSGFLLSKIPLDSAAVCLEKITPEARNSIFAPMIDHIVTRIEVRETRQKAKEQIKAGAEAPDFTLKTTDGSDFTLSSLRGKYVVLDFWGSWCGWCIKGFPKMKAYYEKHAGKFEIVGIACNDKDEAWRKAVVDNSLPWINIINPRNLPEDQDLCVKYGIQGYPTKIILDPNGQIISVVVGERPEFYTQLDELLK